MALYCFAIGFLILAKELQALQVEDTIYKLGNDGSDVSDDNSFPGDQTMFVDSSSQEREDEYHTQIHLLNLNKRLKFLTKRRDEDINNKWVQSILIRLKHPRERLQRLGLAEEVQGDSAVTAAKRMKFLEGKRVHGSTSWRSK